MAKHVRRRIPKDIWDNYFKFTVDRNPWDKILSHYHFVRQRYKNFNENISFDYYLTKSDLPLNYEKYTSDNNELLVDRVIKCENLNKELGDVFEQLRVPYKGTLDVYEKSYYRKIKK